jgi:hypothetical protein
MSFQVVCHVFQIDHQEFGVTTVAFSVDARESNTGIIGFDGRRFIDLVH